MRMKHDVKCLKEDQLKRNMLKMNVYVEWDGRLYVVNSPVGVWVDLFK